MKGQIRVPIQVLTHAELQDVRLVRPTDRKSDSFYYNLRTQEVVGDAQIPHPCYVPEFTGSLSELPQ